ncbi:hypothetical protein R1flu_028222 [Riccia fluitans]|uniref:Uncharacterized protein n=1 Tax=Riccia fluitans TaxID=41844 RepID=A0ABD1XL29_9MARC
MASVVAASSVVAPVMGVSASSSIRSHEITSVQAGLKGSVFSGKSKWQSKTQTNARLRRPLLFASPHTATVTPVPGER